MMRAAFPEPGSRDGLARQPASNVVVPWLVRLRWFSLAALAGVGWAAHTLLHVQLPLGSLAVLLLAMAGTNAGLAWQLRSPKPQRLAIGAALILDVCLLAGMLYLVGGPLNPLSIIYLVSITIAAVALGHRWALGIAALANVAYALTFVFNRPLEFSHPHTSDHLLPLHLLGMWVAFIAATGLVAHFVGRVSEALAQRERELAAARIAAGRSERLAALLSLGAGAAHELATPLSTIGTAAGELERLMRLDQSSAASPATAYVEMIHREVDRCAVVLDQLSGRAGATSAMPSTIDVQALANDLRGRLGEGISRRLDVVLPEHPRPVTLPVEALRQTLIALVRNAVDASAPGQRVFLRIAQERGIRLEVVDRGRGMTDEEIARAGEPFYTTKGPGGGLGLGLFLARAFAEQMNGSLTFTSKAGGGTAVVLELPTT